MTLDEKVILILLENSYFSGSKITLDTTFSELNLDSLAFVEIVASVEDEFGIMFDNERKIPRSTVGGFIEHIKNEFPSITKEW